MLLLLAVLSLAYAALEGAKEAILYSRKGADAFDFNEHIVYVQQRALFVIAPFCALDLTLRDLGVWFMFFALCFSFIHNGAYYRIRKAIDGTYEKGWWDDSKTSTARIEIKLWERILMFALGVTVFFIYIYFR